MSKIHGCYCVVIFLSDPLISMRDSVGKLCNASSQQLMDKSGGQTLKKFKPNAGSAG